MDRVLHLSDLHVRAKRLVRWQYLIEEIVGLAESYRVDFVAIAGDLTGWDAPHVPTQDERLVVVRLVRQLSDVAPVYVVQGNHDLAGEIRLLELCGGRYPVTVATEPRLDCEVGMIPYPTRAQWVRRPGEQSPREEIEEARRRIVRALERFRGCQHVIVHAAIDGALAGHGVKIRWSEISVPADVPALFSERLFLPGHLHLPQEVAPNWVYPGSVVPTDYGHVQPCRVLIWEGRTYTSHTLESGYRLVTVRSREDVAGLRATDYVKIVTPELGLATVLVADAEQRGCTVEAVEVEQEGEPVHTDRSLAWNTGGPQTDGTLLANYLRDRGVSEEQAARVLDRFVSERAEAGGAI